MEVDTSFLAVFCLPNRQKQGLCLKQLKAGPENQLQAGVPYSRWNNTSELH